MSFSIEKFSSVLCLAYGTNQEVGYLSPQCFVLTDNSEDVLIAIHKLGKIFEKELHPIVEKLVEIGELETFHSLMRANLSYYVKMSENPTYFKFILLCSLIEEVVTVLFISQHCFCITKVISVCLIAVYYACYNDLFKRNEEFESLGSYCQRLNSPQASDGGVSQLLLEETREMFESAEENDYTNFSPTDFEKMLLNDTLDLIPVEVDLADDEVSTSAPFEYKSSLTDVFLTANYDLVATQRNLPEDAITTTTPSSVNSTNVQEYLNSLGSEYDSSEESEFCFPCRRRCYEYLEEFQREFGEEVNEVNNE